MAAGGVVLWTENTGASALRQWLRGWVQALCLQGGTLASKCCWDGSR